MILTLIFGVCFALVRTQQVLYPNPKFLHPGNLGVIERPQQAGLIYLRSSPKTGHAWYEHPQQRQVLDDAEVTINAKSSLSDKEQAPRFLLNYPDTVFANNAMLGNNAAVGPLLFRTYLFTFVQTSTIQKVSLCIPAAQFSAGAGATTCVRRRRDIAEFLDSLEFLDDGESQSIKVQPTSVNRVEVTALKSDSDNGHTISSSKEETQAGSEEPISSERVKRFFNVFARTATITSYSFVTETVRKQVSVVAAQANNAAVVCGAAPAVSCLVCVPPGYGVC